MIARLRRHRWLFAILLAASPGFAGQLVQALHPCPADSMAMSGSHAAMAGMLHDGGDAAPHAPAPEHHHGSCSCIGCCFTPVMTTPPSAVVAVMAVPIPRHITWPVIEATYDRPAIVNLLPEKTAPPLA